METTVERLEGNKVKLTVTVSVEEVGEAVDEAYQRAAAKVSIPGFRKGRAPKPVIDRYVGRERVLADAQEEIMSVTYSKALDAEDLRPIDSPEVGELPDVREGADFMYSAEIDIRPCYELSSVEDISAEVPPAKAADREVDAQIELLRERFGILEPVEDRGIEDTDFALISFTGTVGGEAYEGNVVDKYLYELGSGQMPKDFEDALLGHEAGDSYSVSFEIPETSPNPDLVGKTAEFDVTVHEVKRKVLPELDDEFAGNVAGMDTLEQLRGDIRSKLDDAKTLAHIREIEREGRRVLAERLQGEVPEKMVHQRRDGMLRDFYRGLDARGITLEDYIRATGVNAEGIQSDVEEQAAAVLREELALEALFRSQGMEVTEQDIDKEFEEIAGRGERSVEEVRKDWEESGLLSAVREQVMQRKATRWLMENVKVTERESGEEAKPEGGGEKEEEGS